MIGRSNCSCARITANELLSSGGEGERECAPCGEITCSALRRNRIRLTLPSFHVKTTPCFTHCRFEPSTRLIHSSVASHSPN